MRKEILRVLVVAVFGLPALSGNSAIAASEWESAAKLLSKTALNFGIGEAQIPVPEMQEIVVPEPTITERRLLKHLRR